jgi:hypothetical protein
MPSPRTVEIAPADIVFDEGIGIDLGGMTVSARHIGGDHSADSSLIYVEPDRVLFMGDCFSASPAGVTHARAVSARRSRAGPGARQGVPGGPGALSTLLPGGGARPRNSIARIGFGSVSGGGGI